MSRPFRLAAVAAALTFWDAMLRGWMVVMLALLVLFAVGMVRLQIRATRNVQILDRKRMLEDVNTPDVTITFDDGAPPAAAASDVYVGLLAAGIPTGPRKRAKVHLDGMVRFQKPVVLPTPPDGYDEVGIWENDATWKQPPLVTLSTWLCTADNGKTVTVGA